MVSLSLKKVFEDTNPDVKRRDELFDKLANDQRGAPELAMQKLTEPGISQLYGYITEHVGDLTHRMAQRPSFFRGGFEWVSEKVEKTLRTLTFPYGFRKEMFEQIESNLAYEQRKGNDLDKDKYDYIMELKELSKKYADEHRKLKVYNDAQTHARDAAVAVGEWKFNEAIRHIRELDRHIKMGYEHWEEYALEFRG